MASTEFMEFLLCVKEKGKEISLLSADVEMIHMLKSRYLACVMDRAAQDSIIDVFKENSLAFHTKCKEIKTGIEQIKEKYIQNESFHINMERHIMVLYTNLKNISKKFLDVKSSFLKLIDERGTSHSNTFNEETSSEARNTPTLLNRAGGAREKSANEDDAEAGVKADKSIQNILSTLNELNTTFIELNQIISSSSFDIEGAASKSFYNRNTTIGVNTQIETSIVRRKKRRMFKVVILVLLLIVCTALGVFCGRSILDFIIKLKNALK
ncbi:hypothetical protein NEPAR07_0551 [Nematocida parisii]|uniref:t-SNARE coiled-coil homology domain-containing protein n=1 Tax=Nematocida parisii (strain ERTm3) TaxID=935791 RepID=I3EDA7_NEMP3|nr:hypothetical protein NEQG_02539 [Nematocida parisii ERTm3]KAI5143189.1 hypothetical protein NEPAR07_0551 [Nematocida parisii]